LLLVGPGVWWQNLVRTQRNHSAGDSFMNRAFPAQDVFWVEVLSFLRAQATDADRILAPKEFLEELPGTFGYGIGYAFPLSHFSLVVLHKGMYHYFPLSILEELQTRCVPIFANAVFVVFAFCPRLAAVSDVHYQAFALALDDLRQRRKGERTEGWGTAGRICGVVVTTYNRSQALARSLPQIARLGAPVVVVDDGSLADHREQNRNTAAANGTQYLLLPQNRGLPAALNAGIAYWLADPQVEWISYFQDDVDVHPALFVHLAKVQDATAWPVLTGRFSSRHPSYGRESVNGEEILRMRGISGQHIHAHREYWRGVLPIPAPTLGAPRPGGGLAGQGPEEDFWISAWSPNSIAKRGGFVACLPGLVRAFLSSAEDSTWGRELGEVDATLRKVPS
jgi:hypothetical protein